MYIPKLDLQKQEQIVDYLDKKVGIIDKMIAKAHKLCTSQAKKSEYGDCAKYVVFKSVNKKGEITDDSIASVLNEELIQRDRELAGYNLLVTSEIEMSEQSIYDTYHNLWRIEQSFRIMKSELNARPVFLQKENSIKGHFLICYLSVLLSRILEYKVLNRKYCSSQLFEFIREYTVIQLTNTEYINISTSTKLIRDLSVKYKMPYSCFNLSDKQIKDRERFKFFTEYFKRFGVKPVFINGKLKAKDLDYDYNWEEDDDFLNTFVKKKPKNVTRKTR